MTNHMVSDMATRIRNAIQIRKPIVKVYNTRVTNSIAQILIQEGFISGVVKIQPSEDRKKRFKESQFLLLELKYTGKI